jgi:hypothetical protein
MSHPSQGGAGSALFDAVYKRPAEGMLQDFCFLPLALEGFLSLGFLGLWLDSFALGFLVWEAFGRKRIAKGKLLKGKVWLKRGG